MLPRTLATNDCAIIRPGDQVRTITQTTGKKAIVQSEERSHPTTLMCYMIYFPFLPQAYSLSSSKQHDQGYPHNYSNNYRALQCIAMHRMMTVNHSGLE